MRIFLLLCLCLSLFAEDRGFSLSEAMRRSASDSSADNHIRGDDDDDDSFSLFDIFCTSGRSRRHQHYHSQNHDSYHSGVDSIWNHLIIAPIFAHTRFDPHEIDAINQAGVSIGMATEQVELSFMYLFGPITFSEQSLSLQAVDHAASEDFALQCKFLGNVGGDLRPFVGIGISTGLTSWDFQQTLYIDGPINEDYLSHYSTYLRFGFDYRIDEVVHFSVEAQPHSIGFNTLTDAGFSNDVFSNVDAVRYQIGLNLQF